MIRFLNKFKPKDSTGMVYSFEVDGSGVEGMVMNYVSKVTEELIPRMLAEKYIEDFGPEILKRIQEKTIESKAIQKVIENLRKELKNSYEAGK